MMDQDTANAILQSANDTLKARILTGINSSLFEVQKVVIDLTSARLETNPYEIKFPFKSFWVQDATDSNVSVSFKPGTVDQYQSAFEIQKNDSWSSDYPTTAAFLHWSAQSGKSITIIFFVSSEFKSGTQQTVTSGGVSITNGDAISTAVVTLAAATAAAAFAASTTRKRGLLQNNSGASIWIGPSTVTNSGATLGLEVQAGDTYAHNNASALYAYSVAGGDVLAFTES